MMAWLAAHPAIACFGLYVVAVAAYVTLRVLTGPNVPPDQDD